MDDHRSGGDDRAIADVHPLENRHPVTEPCSVSNRNPALGRQWLGHDQGSQFDPVIITEKSAPRRNLDIPANPDI